MTEQTPEEIISQYAEKYGFTVEQIKGRQRPQDLVAVRRMIVCAIRSIKKENGKPKYTLPEIGKLMDRDHTSILHLLQTVDISYGEAVS